MIIFSSKSAIQLTHAKEQLGICFRFLEDITPYWAMSGEQHRLLKRLLSGDMSFMEVREAPNSGEATKANDGIAAFPDSGLPESSQADMDKVSAPKPGSGTSSALLTTDSGFVVFLTQPEMQAPLEQATLLSLSRLSMLEK